jgi:phosphatidylserine decarboxylase
MTVLTRLFLSILSHKTFSRIYGKIVRLRYPRFIIKRLIAHFQKSYNIDMTEYMGKPEDYKSLCDFFIRPLDPSKRKLAPTPNTIVSPADGKLTDVELIYSDQATQVKGKTYSISEMIGEKIDFSEGWYVAVIYLSPSNYHRYHYPVTGKITRYLHTGPRLYPVNHLGLNFVDRLFVRNERIVSEIEVTHNNDKFTLYAVAVGATFVGTIVMEYINGKPESDTWVPVNLDVNQLEEMGRFEMGSTIVFVIPKKHAGFIEEKKGLPVRVGDPIFELCKAC